MKLPQFTFMAFLYTLLVGHVPQLQGQESRSPSIEVHTLKADEEIIYKTFPEGEDLKLHVFYPEGHHSGVARPSIVFFFGGGWSKGEPKQFFGQCRYLARRGMVAISADYRTKQSHGTAPIACVQDAKSAVRYIRANAHKLGIDPLKLCAGGGSAGGHIAAATATLKGYDEPGESKAVSCVPAALVLFNPVYDNSQKGYAHKRVRPYWREFSPRHNLSPTTPPTTVFFGDQDRYISVKLAKEYQATMQSHGVRSDLHLFPGEKHGFFNERKFEETIKLADAFLVSLGFLESAP